MLRVCIRFRCSSKHKMLYKKNLVYGIVQDINHGNDFLISSHTSISHNGNNDHSREPNIDHDSSRGTRRGLK